jgi:hypothetical protein
MYFIYILCHTIFLKKITEKSPCIKLNTNHDVIFFTKCSEEFERLQHVAIDQYVAIEQHVLDTYARKQLSLAATDV